MSPLTGYPHRPPCPVVVTKNPERVPYVGRILARVRSMIFTFVQHPGGGAELSYASEGVRDLFDLSPEEAMRDLRSWMRRIHPQDRPAFEASLTGSGRELRPWSQLFRIRARPHQTRWAEGSAEPQLEADGTVVWHGIIQDISEREQARADVARHARLQFLISETATRFIHLPLGQVQDAVVESLGEIAGFFQVDRAYVFAYDWSRRTCRNTHEWCAPGVEPQIEQLQETPMDIFPDWLETHMAGREVYIPDVPGLPPGDFRELLVAQGIQSIIAVPMMGPDGCRGFVGFDAVRIHRTYTQAEQRMLGMFARMLVSIDLRRDAQAALEHSERRFADVIAAAGEFVWEAGPDWRITYLSSRAGDVLGLPVAACSGRDIRELLGLDDDAAAQTCDTPCFNLPTRTTRPDGCHVFLRTNLRVLADESGRPLGYLGLTSDTTREEEAMRALARERDQLRMFFEVSLDLLCVTDRDGRFVRVGAAWEPFLGQSIAEIEGTTFLAYVHEDDRAATLNAMKALRAGREIRGFVNRYRTRDGSHRELEWRATPSEGLVFACARDVTETRRVARALEAGLAQERAAAEIKGRLISMASHEFRTPLASIMLNVELLQLQAERITPNDLRKRLSLLADTTSHLADIVGDVLDYSALGRGGDTRETNQELDLRTCIDEAAAALPVTPEGPLRLEVTSAPAALVIVARPSLLRRVIGNLLENAVKYSPDGGLIRIETRAVSQGCELIVQDEGIGVPAESRDRLFTPFHRAANVGQIRGTGLGLSIVKEALDRLGGTIRFEPVSTSGSRFIVRLPWVSPTPSPRA